MHVMIKALIIAWGILPAQPPVDLRSPVDFFAEEITMEVNESEVSIGGVYYFRNNTSKDKSFPIIFPFYVDSLTSFPDRIDAYVISGSDTSVINFQSLEERHCIRLGIPMIPDSVTIWHLDYNQKISSRKARYILTSTSAWKKPLEKATYRFIAPKSFDINYAWPEADTVITGDKVTLIATRTDFLPPRDMEIIWEQIQQ